MFYENRCAIMGAKNGSCGFDSKSDRIGIKLSWFEVNPNLVRKIKRQISLIGKLIKKLRATGTPSETKSIADDQMAISRQPITLSAV